MIETLDKSHIGKTLYGIPWGNIARYNTGITPIKVVSVAKTWARIGDTPNDVGGEMYHVEDNCFKADCNSGYTLFETEEDAKSYQKNEKQLEEIRAFFRSREQISAKQIEQIHQLLFK